MITKKGKKRVGVEDNSHVEIRTLARKSILSAERNIGTDKEYTKCILKIIIPSQQRM